MDEIVKQLEVEAEKSRSRRLWFGVLLSLLWGVIVCSLYFTQDHPTNLNSWGDFFAGAFAPLAFLWLVIGYAQQGDELKHSRKALLMQAKELANSVQHQGDLVEVNREQLRGEMERSRFERHRQQQMARPKFVFSLNQSSGAGDNVDYNVSITNVGNNATSILLEFEPPARTYGFFQIASLLAREKHEFGFSFGKDGRPITNVLISYYDALGEEGTEAFQFVSSAAKQSHLSFNRVGVPTSVHPGV